MQPISTSRSPRNPGFTGITAAIVVCLCSPATALAQAQKPPGVGYVDPPVIRIGTTTDVTLGGYDWTDDLEWFIHGNDVRFERFGPLGDYFLTPPPYWIGPRASMPPQPISREVAARITVDADARPGLVRWQVANANGASSTAVLYVSRDHEVHERRSRDFPQRLPSLPVAVSGRLSRLTEVDRYQVVASQNGLIVVDLMARRLGSQFQGQLEVRDDEGRLIADFADTQGLDGTLAFPVQADQTYLVSLHDVDFRGDRAFLYRLAFREGPHVLATLPARGQRGTTSEVECVGYGLATGTAVLESVRQTIALPSGPAVTHIHKLTTPAGHVDVEIPLSDHPELVAGSLTPNSSGELPLTAPAAVTGQLTAEQHEFRYVWEAAENDSWSVALQSQAIGGSLDVRLKLLDPTGKTLAEDDDRPGLLDAGLELTTTKAGTYTAVVTSLSPLAGLPVELYRLELQRRTPDFALTVPQTVNVPLGGKAALKIAARRSGGFTGSIAVAVAGLPRGVTQSGDWTIPENKNEIAVTLEVAVDADVVASWLRFEGSAMIDGTSVSHEGLAQSAGNLAPESIDELLTPQVLLAVTMEPPFEIKVVDRERQREVHRGTTYLAELEILRQEGFTGPLQIAMTAQQARDRQGIRGPLLDVPEGATRVYYPCTMPEWLGTDLTRRIVVHGVGAVPDPSGRVRSLTRSGDSRITMILEGALLKLACVAGEMVAKPGDILQIPVSVARSVTLPLETTVELVVPEEIAGLIEASPLALPPGQDQGVLTIRSQADARLHGPWELELRATALQDGKWPVVSRTILSLDFE